MDPMVSCKSGGSKKDAIIGWIGHVSYHLGSLVSIIELTVLCALVCKVGYFDA